MAESRLEGILSGDDDGTVDVLGSDQKVPQSRIEELMMGVGKEVYSTEEQVIGRWIDGKPIYRRVVTGIIQSSPSAITDFSSWNVDLFTDIKGIHKASTGSIFGGVINTGNGADTYIFAWANYVNKTIMLDCNYAGYVGRNVWITLEYTKTTD